MNLPRSGELAESSKAGGVRPADSVANEQVCTVNRLQTLLKDYRLARDNAQANSAVYPTGLARLDEALPAGGLQPATVVDCLCPSLLVQVPRGWFCTWRWLFREIPLALVIGRLFLSTVITSSYPPAAADAGGGSIPAANSQAGGSQAGLLGCGAVFALFGHRRGCICFLPIWRRFIRAVCSLRLKPAVEWGSFCARSKASLKVPDRLRPFNCWSNLLLPVNSLYRWRLPSGGETGKRLVNVTVIRVREGMPAGPFVLEIPDEAGFMPTF